MNVTNRRLFACFLAFMSCVTSALAAEGTTAASVANSRDPRQIEIASASSGEHYVVRVYVPRQAPPPSGFPVLYVLDGNVLFNTFADAMRNRSQAGEIEPAVVVGVSSADGPNGGDRTFDFTWTDLTTQEKEVIKDLGDNPRWGGAENFFRTLQFDVKPRVAAMTKVDASREALLGWSLGGLFTIHTMFEHPQAFSSFIAVSPSLWRSNRAIFGDIATFETKIQEDPHNLRVFLGVGENEERVPSGMHFSGMTHEELVNEMRYCKMVSNFHDFVGRLRPAFTSRNLRWKSRVFEGDSHNSVPWSSVNPILDYVFPLPPASAPAR